MWRFLSENAHHMPCLSVVDSFLDCGEKTIGLMR